MPEQMAGGRISDKCKRHATRLRRLGGFPIALGDRDPPLASLPLAKPVDRDLRARWLPPCGSAAKSPDFCTDRRCAHGGACYSIQSAADGQLWSDWRFGEVPAASDNPTPIFAWLVQPDGNVVPQRPLLNSRSLRAIWELAQNPAGQAGP